MNIRIIKLIDCAHMLSHQGYFILSLWSLFRWLTIKEPGNDLIPFASSEETSFLSSFISTIASYFISTDNGCAHHVNRKHPPFQCYWKFIEKEIVHCISEIFYLWYILFSLWWGEDIFLLNNKTSFLIIIINHIE